MTLNQSAFRFRNDDGNETGASWMAAENTNPAAQLTAVNIRLRIETEETAGSTDNFTAQLQYNHNGGGWNNVAGSSSVIQASASSQFSDGTATTNQLTTSSATFQANGVMDEVDGSGGSQTLKSRQNENEFCFIIVDDDVADTDTIDLRIDGLDTYSVTPTLTVSKPSASNDGAAMHHHLQNLGAR